MAVKHVLVQKNTFLEVLEAPVGTMSRSASDGALGSSTSSDCSSVSMSSSRRIDLYNGRDNEQSSDSGPRVGRMIEFMKARGETREVIPQRGAGSSREPQYSQQPPHPHAAPSSFQQGILGGSWPYGKGGFGAGKGANAAAASLAARAAAAAAVPVSSAAAGDGRPPPGDFSSLGAGGAPPSSSWDPPPPKASGGPAPSASETEEERLNRLRELHAAGTCTPCHWMMSRGMCKKGDACVFCHDFHDKNGRPRPRKVKRGQCKKEAKKLDESINETPELLKEHALEMGSQSKYMNIVVKGTLQSLVTKFETLGDHYRAKLASAALAATMEVVPTDSIEATNVVTCDSVNSEMGSSSHSHHTPSSSASSSRSGWVQPRPKQQHHQMQQHPQQKQQQQQQPKKMLLSL